MVVGTVLLLNLDSGTSGLPKILPLADHLVFANKTLSRAGTQTHNFLAKTTADRGCGVELEWRNFAI